MLLEYWQFLLLALGLLTLAVFLFHLDTRNCCPNDGTKLRRFQRRESMGLDREYFVCGNCTYEKTGTSIPVQERRTRPPEIRHQGARG